MGEIMSKKSINNKKKKKIPFLYKLSACLLGGVTLFFIGSIICLNVLNIALLVLVSVIILGLCCISIFLVLKSKIKVIGFCLSIVLMILFGGISFYINKTSGFLSGINLAYKTYNYSVVVLSGNDYHALSDIEGEIGYLDDESVEGDKALTKLLDKVDVDVNGYDDSYSLVNALVDDEVEAILIEESYLEMLNENMVLDKGNLVDNVEKVYDFDVIINTGNILDDIDVTNKPFNIYVSGIDTFGEISDVSRSDVNMVVSVNPKTRQILVTSIPRDYYVKLHGKTGYRDKLTHAGLYGVDTSIATIEDLLDIDINYYVKVNFSSVIEIVDAIGGIKVYSDYAFTSVDNYSYGEGYNKLNGEEALSFARERKAFAAGDRQRVKNQQAVLEAILDKCMSSDIIVKYSRILDSVSGSFVTNMPMSRMTSLIKMQLAKNYDWNIVMNSLEGSDGNNYTYSTPKQTSYVMLVNDDSVSYGSELVTSVLEGKNLTDKLMNDIRKKITGEDVVAVSSYVSDSKFKAKLVRSSVMMTLGDDYIYHGFIAMYDGEEVTNSQDIVVEFVINGKRLDDYKDLVWYITYELGSGEYTINYNISYKSESVKLNQSLVIEEG